MATSRLSRPISAFTRNFNAHERRLVVQVAVIGLVVWAVTFVLKTSVHLLFDSVMAGVEGLPLLALVLVPLTLGALGTAAVVLYRSRTIHYRDREGFIHPIDDVEGDGLERAIALYFASEPAMEQILLGRAGVDARWDLPTFSLAARKFLATLFTLGSGGSGGLEASVTLVGESLAAGVFKPRPQFHLPADAGYLNRLRRWWRLNDPDDLQTAQLAGVAAAVATLLGTPFAAAFFAIEVMYRRRPIIEKLLFALIAALVAYFMTNLVTGHPLLFSVNITTRPVFTLRYYGVLVVMAVIISVISILFTRLRGFSETWFHTRIPNVWMRHVAGALLTGVAALIAVRLTGQNLSLVLGTGDGAIEAALLGRLTASVAIVALVAKLVATLATITSGGSAGLLIPSIYFGAMVAAALAPDYRHPGVDPGGAGHDCQPGRAGQRAVGSRAVHRRGVRFAVHDPRTGGAAGQHAAGARQQHLPHAAGNLRLRGRCCPATACVAYRCRRSGPARRWWTCGCAIASI